MNKKVALVLSGGGARGYAHIGVIRALEDRGYEIVSLAGTSMGALVGGIYTGGGLEAFEKWVKEADIKEIMRVLDFSLHEPGLIKGEKIMQKIAGMLSTDKIEKLSKPYVAVATDLKNRREEIFMQGSLIRAMRASIAIPTVFTPVTEDNKILVDGGIMNNIPVNHVERKNAGLTLAVCVNAPVPVDKTQRLILEKYNKPRSEYAKKRKRILEWLNKRHLLSRKKEKTEAEENMGTKEIIDRSLHLLIYHSSLEIIKDYPPDLLINFSRDLASTFDFLKAEPLIEIGYQTAMRVLENYEKSI